MEREKKAETLSDIWLGSNLQYDGLKEVLKSLSSSSKPKEPQPDEVNSEWKRLASFMNKVPK